MSFNSVELFLSGETETEYIHMVLPSEEYLSYQDPDAFLADTSEDNYILDG